MQKQNVNKPVDGVPDSSVQSLMKEVAAESVVGEKGFTSSSSKAK